VVLRERDLGTRWSVRALAAATGDAFFEQLERVDVQTVRCGIEGTLDLDIIADVGLRGFWICDVEEPFMVAVDEYSLRSLRDALSGAFRVVGSEVSFADAPQRTTVAGEPASNGFGRRGDRTEQAERQHAGEAGACHLSTFTRRVARLKVCKRCWLEAQPDSNLGGEGNADCRSWSEEIAERAGGHA